MPPAHFSGSWSLFWLHGFRWEICLAYLDDVVVFGRTWEEHLERLRLVLTRLQVAHLKLHPKKCQFFKQSVCFLDHNISNNGVGTDPAKISIVANWPTPANIPELRSFLGLASYYRQFAHHFAEIAAPLHRLQEKGSAFQWTDSCNVAFETLKRKLISTPILEGQLARWLEQLQEFDFKTEHRLGRQHSNADALSRVPQPQTATVCTIAAGCPGQ